MSISLQGSEVILDQSRINNILDGEIHNCWVLFHKEIIFIESLQSVIPESNKKNSTKMYIPL